MTWLITYEYEDGIIEHFTYIKARDPQEAIELFRADIRNIDTTINGVYKPMDWRTWK